MRIVLMLAVLPAFLLMVYVYKRDKVEKEPIKLLVLLAAMGAVSAIPILITEFASEFLLRHLLSSESTFYTVVEIFIGVALVEEGFKFLFLKKFTWKNKAFNYTFDGIVYAVFISLGFAAVENFIYLFNFSISTTIGRALLSIPAHMTFAVFMGYYYSRAKKASIDEYPEKSFQYKLLAIIIPTLLHGFYDYCIISKFKASLVVFFIFVITLDVVAFLKVRKESKNDMAFISPQSPSSDDSWDGGFEE